MKTFIIFKPYVIAFLTVVFIGCSTVNTTSINDELNTNISPTPNLEETPKKNDGRIVNEEGWQIPPREKRRKLRERVIDMLSEDGKNFKVTITQYVPIGGFIYSEESLLNEQKTTQLRGNLSMAGFTEFKLKEKVFLYTIMAITRKPETQKGDNTTHERHFGYQIVDRDGDGKFETLITDKSKFLVPAWAID